MNNQNTNLAEPKKFILPADMPEGDFTQEELAEDMEFRPAAHCSLNSRLTIRKTRITKKIWSASFCFITPTMLTGRKDVSMMTIRLLFVPL